jgi:hypothetical protein
MFINVTAMAAKWILDNPEVKILQVDYDDLIEFPDIEITVDNVIKHPKFNEKIELIYGKKFELI